MLYITFKQLSYSLVCQKIALKTKLQVPVYINYGYSLIFLPFK